MEKRIAIIVAVDEASGFGKNGKIPWHFPEDLKHFKEVTTNSICIMGRRTYEDMLEMRRQRDEEKGKKIIRKILPGRDCYVVSNTPNFTAPGATVVPNIRAVLESIDQDDSRPIFILGGYRMFVEGINLVSHIFMTIVEGRYGCDRFFPVQLLNRAFDIVDGTKTENLSFITYQRRGAEPWEEPSQDQGSSVE